jgi:hypothetical protein
MMSKKRKGFSLGLLDTYWAWKGRLEVKILHGHCHAQQVAEKAIEEENGPDGVDGLGTVSHVGKRSLQDNSAVEAQLEDYPRDVAQKSPGKAPFALVDVEQAL